MGKDKPKGKSTKTKIPGIEQLPDGRFRVRARWTDKTGKRHKREGTAETFAEAVALKEALLESEETNRPERRMRFREYAEAWIETYAKRVKPRSAATIANALKASIRHFGTMYLDAIELSMVRDWYADLVGQPGSIVTKNKNLKVLKQVLEQAVDDDLIDRNPARKVRGKAEGPTQGPRARSLDLNGFALFEGTTRKLIENEEIRPDIGRYILTLLWTGCRFSEVAALRWSDLREEQKDLVIQRSVSWNVEKETKTGQIRHIPMGSALHQVLTEQSEWLSLQSDPRRSSGLIYPSERPHQRDTYFIGTYRVAKAMRLVCKRAEIHRITHHSLRRTMEQCLRLVGIDVLVRRSILGWYTSDVQGVYAQVTPIERTRAIEVLETEVRKIGTFM